MKVGARTSLGRSRSVATLLVTLCTLGAAFALAQPAAADDATPAAPAATGDTGATGTAAAADTGSATASTGDTSTTTRDDDDDNDRDAVRRHGGTVRPDDAHRDVVDGRCRDDRAEHGVAHRWIRDAAGRRDHHPDVDRPGGRLDAGADTDTDGHHGNDTGRIPAEHAGRRCERASAGSARALAADRRPGPGCGARGDDVDHAHRFARCGSAAGVDPGRLLGAADSVVARRSSRPRAGTRRAHAGRSRWSPSIVRSPRRSRTSRRSGLRGRRSATRRSPSCSRPRRSRRVPRRSHRRRRTSCHSRA